MDKKKAGNSERTAGVPVREMITEQQRVISW